MFRSTRSPNGTIASALALSLVTTQAAAQTGAAPQAPSRSPAPVIVGTAPSAPKSGLLIGGLLVAGAVAVAAMAAGGGGDDGDDNGGGSEDDENAPIGGSPSFPEQFNHDIWRERTAPYAGLSARDFETAEYEWSYGLGMVNPSHRYADGGTGAGTLLSVFDTGVDADHEDLDANIVRDLSFSYFTNGSDVTDHDGHGTHVAGVMVAEKNGAGMHGIAFGAHLAVFQGLGWEGGPKASLSTSAAWADANRRALRAGAIAMNHSWSFVTADGEREGVDMYDSARDVEHYLGTNLVDSLRDSAGAGMVSVFSAGNDGAANPSLTAGLPVHLPELDGHWLAVAAVGSDKRIASYSNRCGQARDFCLVAPGTSIISTASRHAGSADYRSMSGTSFAAPYVTGAVGVLKSNFPELTGAEITRILLDTAEDLGASGVDPVYGHGLLDLENAVAPQGHLSVKTASTRDGGEIHLDGSRIAGDAVASGALVAALSGHQMMVSDRYDRGYGVDMGEMVAVRTDALYAADTALAAFTRDLRIPDEPGLGGEVRGYAYATAFASPYASLIEAPSFSHHASLGDVILDLETAFDAGDGSYTSVEVSAPLGDHSVSLEIGQLRESGQVLGTEVTGAFGADMASRTSFARLGSGLALEPNTMFNLSASWGVSDFESGGVLREGDRITSSALAIGVSRQNLFREGDSLSIGASTPLGMTGGEITVDRPVAMAASEGTARSNVVYRDRDRISLQEHVRPIDLQVGYGTSFGPGRLAVGAVWRPDTGMGSAVAARAGFSMSF